MTFEKVKWGEVLSIKNGKNQKAVENPYGQYPIYGSGGVMGYADDYLCEAGTTIIGRKGSINNPIFVKEKFWNVDTAFGLQAGKSLDEKYLYYFCKTYNFLMHNKATTLPSLTKADLLNIQIPLPPLATQKKIAAILDAADAHRQKTKQLLAKYDELAQSIFLDMFGDPVTNPKGWKKVKLGTVTKMKAGKFVPASEIFSSPSDIMYECYGGNGLRGYVNSYTHNGDFVLIGRQGALCGNVKLVRGVFHATEHAIVCSPKKKYETMWLYFLLDYLNLNKYATGAAQPGLNVGKLVEIEIVLPSHDLQRQFVERFNLIEAQKVHSQQGLDQSTNLFNGLLQKAFKGELVE